MSSSSTVPDYVFKTYDFGNGDNDDSDKVVLLEEGRNPMGGEDGTTGLISWQVRHKLKCNSMMYLVGVSFQNVSFCK